MIWPMRVRRVQLLCLALLFAGSSAVAQSTVCRPETEWHFPTRMRAIMKSAAHGDAVFETEMYSNAGMWRHTFKGGHTTMIYLRGKEAAISFISGTEKTDPSTISEDTVHLIPWQINNKWKQLGPPCLLPDGVALTFDYADRYQDKDQPFQFRGEIKRTGARMTYAMSSEHTYDSDGASGNTERRIGLRKRAGCAFARHRCTGKPRVLEKRIPDDAGDRSACLHQCCATANRTPVPAVRRNTGKIA
ncbi:hypothetical protein LP420_04415 [Massilia sp. B-10]|nr:hypothetical protein LP420_04415 [Massilia sp. B-10]